MSKRPEPYGLGISWLWMLPDTHPFHQAGVDHDIAYDLKEEKSSKKADDKFLRDCLKIARERNSLWLKSQAYLFYGLASAWGMASWR